MVRTLDFHCLVKSSIPGQGTKIPQAEQYGQRKRKKEKKNGVAMSKIKDAEAFKPTATVAANRWKQGQIFRAPISLGMVTAAVKLKDACSWEEANYDKPRQLVKKQRHHFPDKGLFSQSYGFLQQSCMDVRVGP